MRPGPAAYGLDLLGDSPSSDAVRLLLYPLARDWTRDPAAVPEAGSLVVCGLHRDLRWATTAPLLGFGRPRPSASLLTGRDLPSLSWMIAKQYVTVRAEVTHRVLLTGEGPAAAPPADVEVLTHEDFETLDIREYLTASPWRRLMVEGHGKDDLVNLGVWGVLGLSDVRTPDGPVSLRPRYGYGHPHRKDERFLIPAGELRAAEIVLNSCQSTPLSDTAMYGTPYQLLLAAVDGTAQTIIGTLTASDSGPPETERLVRQRPADEDLAAVLNAGIADIDPYPVFVRHGIVRGTADSAPGTLGTPHRDREREDTEELLVTALDRAVGWAESGLLPVGHPLKAACASLLKKYTRLLRRTSPAESARIGDRLKQDLAALDRSIAERIADHPDDPMMGYSDYWGERSRVRTPARRVSCDACGTIAQKFTRTGRSRVIPDVEVIVCLRCGDGYFRFADGPRLTTTSPRTLHPGNPLGVTLDLAQARPGTVHYGLLTLPIFSDYTLTDPLRSASVAVDGGFSDSFTLETGPGIVPQGYYYTVFAVQDLSISIARHNFGVVPEPEPEPGAAP
ncbi:hypothetical protein ACFXPI_10095 [Streptomyces sp. NPDC059104]|uniref:hypothetical protein n=1 Tax=Streptomyces sp. NPDC059104 TaxID=3346729 RepID=UPI0036B221BF